jgi:hypothetical protein
MLKISQKYFGQRNTAVVSITLNILLTGALATAGMSVTETASANEQTGVQCPANFDAEINLTSKTLKCKSTTVKEYRLASICSPVAFSNAGIQLRAGVVMQSQGSDTCLAVGTGRTLPSLMQPPFPGNPAASQFTRVVSPGDVDVFTASVHEYVFPEGASYGVGNPAKGVTCEGSFTAIAKSDNNGIVCKKYTQERSADCDFGWRHLPDTNGNRDLCGATLPGTSDGPTKPRGMTKAQLDVDNLFGNVEWKLFARSGADLWKKGEFQFPHHNN